MCGLHYDVSILHMCHIVCVACKVMCLLYMCHIVIVSCIVMYLYYILGKKKKCHI